MDQRWYLFYQKEPLNIKESWARCTPLEKAWHVSFCTSALVMAVLLAAILTWTADVRLAGILLGAVWLSLFPGLVLLVGSIEKSYWVEFKADHVIRHGSRWGAFWKKKIYYAEAKYLVIGKPFIFPYRTQSQWYHRRYGDYINIIGEDKETLFTVRFSLAALDILLEKCSHVEILDCEKFRQLCACVSDEIREADWKIVEQYRGRI